MSRRTALLDLLLSTALWLFIGCGTQPAEREEAGHWHVPVEWSFEDSTLWTFDSQVLEVTKPGSIPDNLRRPGAVATAAGSADVGSFHLRARIRSTQDTGIVGRDVIIVFGYQSPREFYYAHLSNDNTVMVHNGIFVVDNADRRRIDDQSLENPPEARLTDTAWHRVRVDRDAESGTIRVFMDDLRKPLMTATDTTFRSGAIGFGSFDDTGAIRDVRYTEGAPETRFGMDAYGELYPLSKANGSVWKITAATDI